VLYWGLGYNRSHIRSMVQYSTKMIFAVLDVSLIMGLNIGETDKVFCINCIVLSIYHDACKFYYGSPVLVLFGRTWQDGGTDR